MKDQSSQPPGFFHAADCDLHDLRVLTEQSLSPADVPHAARIEKNIPIYDVAALDDLFAEDLLAEWARNLLTGSGVLVLKNTFDDLAPIDAATDVFLRIIDDEGQTAGGGADHFAKAGSNARIWNSLQKLCMADAGVFAAYHGRPAIDAVSRAWLGPGYQMTAQVNLVRPGGAAQDAHRDYHLGFMTANQLEAFPAHAHDLSPVLTLQGGIAHGDTPVESGPTKLLPFSQAYRAGYAAYRLPEFRAHFQEHCVQLPLEKGDVLFFNPATFHAAGDNKSSDIQRLVNLLQVSSAMGRSLENLDRQAMTLALFPALQSGNLAAAETQAAIAACAEGYPFPTCLDTDPPVGGLAPRTQADYLRQAVEEGWTQDRLAQTLTDLTKRQQP